MLELRGANVEALEQELTTFVNETTPRNSSGEGFISMRNHPACGRARALELAERVRPILDRLYPNWIEDNAASKNFEFKQERDACSRLLSRIESQASITDLLPSQDDPPTIAPAGLHPLVWQAAIVQWSTGHRHEAVLAAAKAINSQLQERVNRRDVSDVKLVREAFSDDPPEKGKPRLRFSGIDDDQTRRSMQQGAMGFGAGCFQAIRNPVGHLPNDEHELDEQRALECLASLSLFLRWIDESTVVQD